MKNEAPHQTITFPKQQYKIFILISMKSMFIDFNPFFEFQKQSHIWKFFLSKHQAMVVQLLKEWLFIQPSGEILKAIEEQGHLALNYQGQSTAFKSLKKNEQFLALKIEEMSAEEIKKSNPDLQFKDHFEIVQEIHKQNSEIWTFIQENLLKPSSKSHEELKNLSKIPQLSNIRKVEQIEAKSNNGVAFEYLQSTDRLIAYNGSNKFKLLAEKDQNQRFVISPYLFPEAEKIPFYLTKEEHKLILLFLQSISEQHFQ